MLKIKAWCIPLSGVCSKAGWCARASIQASHLEVIMSQYHCLGSGHLLPHRFFLYDQQKPEKEHKLSYCSILRPPLNITDHFSHEGHSSISQGQSSIAFRLLSSSLPPNFLSQFFLEGVRNRVERELPQTEKDTLPVDYVYSTSKLVCEKPWLVLL